MDRSPKRVRGLLVLPIVLILVLSGVSSVATTSDHLTDTAATNEFLTELDARIEHLSAFTPSAHTSGASDDLLKEALSCVPVGDIFYCPYVGWSSEPKDLLAHTSISSNQIDGDTGVAQQVEILRSLDDFGLASNIANHLIAVRDEAGKALADFAYAQLGYVPSEIIEAFPVAKEYSRDLPTAQNLGWPSGDVTATDFPPGPILAQAELVSSTPAKKQEIDTWCGPASMSFMSWHDPVVGSNISHSQSQWASWLSTTSAGTSIWNMKDQTNLRLTGWKNRVNGYIVSSISGWSITDWSSRMLNTIGTKRAPIILHPRLNSSNSDYVPVGQSTGGHFNVGIGYRIYTPGMWVKIFEPYRFDGTVPVLVWDRLSQVRAANLHNTFQNIAY